MGTRDARAWRVRLPTSQVMSRYRHAHFSIEFGKRNARNGTASSPVLQVLRRIPENGNWSSGSADADSFFSAVATNSLRSSPRPIGAQPLNVSRSATPGPSTFSFHLYFNPPDAPRSFPSLPNTLPGVAARPNKLSFELRTVQHDFAALRPVSSHGSAAHRSRYLNQPRGGARRSPVRARQSPLDRQVLSSPMAPVSWPMSGRLSEWPSARELRRRQMTRLGQSLAGAVAGAGKTVIKGTGGV